MGLPRGFQSKEEAVKMVFPTNFFIYIMARGLELGVIPHLVLGLRYGFPERFFLRNLHEDHGWLSLAIVNFKVRLLLLEEEKP